MQREPEVPPEPQVLRLADIDGASLHSLLGRYNIDLVIIAAQESIPGSFWGDDEAGLIGKQLYARNDSPIHSILHEACHYICMTAQRRMSLDTNAGGDYDEENAVCFLQILLAEQVPTMGPARMCTDMDAWGYTFRLGSAQAWFEHDAQDARAWLLREGIINAGNQPQWRLRL